MEWSATRRRISLTTNTPLHRFSAYQPIGIDKRLFTPLERQRLILSILQARPIDDGAAVDTLMATKDDRSMAWRMALPPEKQSEQEDFDDALLAKSGIDMETEADLLRYEARGGSVLTHVFAVHDIRTRYRIHQKWHRGCPRLYGPARTLLYLDDLRDYFGEKVSAFYTATTSTTSTTSTTITTTTSTTTVPTAATTHPPPPPLPPPLPQVAFYFAFMDHYTRWLAYASAPALVVLIVQVVPFQNLCDQDCTAEARLVTGVDNIMVIPSCVGIAIWAVRLSPLQPPPQCHSPLTTHRSPLTTHHSPLTTHRSLIILHLSGLLPRDVEAQVVDARLPLGRPGDGPPLRALHSDPTFPTFRHPPSLLRGRPGLQRGGADPRGLPSEGDGGGAVEEGLLQSGSSPRPPLLPPPPHANRSPLTAHHSPHVTAQVGAGFMPLGERDAPYFPRAERVRRFGTALMVTVCFMAAVIIGAALSRCRPCGLTSTCQV